MWKDPIVEEVRRARDELAAAFDYDLGALAKFLRDQEQTDEGRVIPTPEKGHRRPSIHGLRRSGPACSR